MKKKSDYTNCGFNKLSMPADEKPGVKLKSTAMDKMNPSGKSKPTGPKKAK